MQLRATHFEPAGFFMIRRPLLPLQTLIDFHRKSNQRPQAFQKELIRLFSQPLLADAIALASPSLFESFSKSVSENEGEIDKRVLRALYKYLIRICSRATPYGLFSGFATGTFSEQTQIDFTMQPACKTYTRLDMSLAAELGALLLSTTRIAQEARLFVNSSLYALGDQFRFVERMTGDAGPVNVLSAVARDDLLEKVFRLCENGCTVKRLTGILCGHVPAECVTEYVEGLVQMQILVSEMEMNVTGPPYMQVLGDHLRKTGASEEQAQRVEQINAVLSANAPLIDISRKLAPLLEAEGVVAKGRVLLHTDLKLKVRHCTISKERVAELAAEFEQISTLFELTRPDPDLETFKSSFLSRYENREIPLLEVLDAESGIGYGTFPASNDQISLLQNLRFPSGKTDDGYSEDVLSDFKENLLRRADRENVSSIVLSEKQLANLKSKGKQPGYFYWLGDILAEDAAEFDQGNFQFLLRALGGSSGAELLGRFCHADVVLADLVKSFTAERQKQTDAVFAEIAHVPSANSAAILSRPHLSDYEIVYLAGSTKPVEKQIAVSDLMVSVLSSRQLSIRSRRLNKRVVPVLSSAHNFSMGLPVYRFLCALAGECQSYGSWDWGRFAGRDFLPRLSYKHLVISRATWNLTKEMFGRQASGYHEFASAWETVRNRMNIPRYFQICKHDQELLIDSCNSFSLELLREAVHKNSKVRIVEVLQMHGKGLVADGRSRYVHELVIPFRPVSKSRPVAPGIRQPQLQQRHFLPASSWLFVKIYLGMSTADRLLAEVIGPYCKKMGEAGRLEKWFFIRYQDPDHHIRLRFYHGTKSYFWRQILTDLHNLLHGHIENGLVTKLQTDTYVRELERYHGLEYERVESIFHIDSQAVVSVISLFSEHNQPEEQRWLTAFRGADLLMDDFGLLLNEKLGLVGGLHRHLLTELGATAELTIQLDRQYRLHRKMISAFMGSCADQLSEIFTERSGLIRQTLAVCHAGTRLPDGIVANFVHMFFNRIFSSASIRQELVMYHYLGKYYKSLITRAKNEYNA